MSAIGKPSGRSPDLAAIRARLAAGDAPAFWRGLDELAGSAEFTDFLHHEFPRLAERLASGTDRRTVLKLMGAALVMGGLAACDEPEQIVPYVRQPEEVVPGRPLHYATALVMDGYSVGAVIESHDGRPTKVEGNPDHPASLGATDAVMQAACLGLYDPDRSRTPLRDGVPASWQNLLGTIAALRQRLAADRGRGLAVLTGTVTSPTLIRQIERLRSEFPEMRWRIHDPLASTAEEAALHSLAGWPLRALPRLDRAAVIVSLDADVLGDGPWRLAAARGFADGRRVRDGGATMSRLYAFESTTTITGASADHRWAVRGSAVEDLARALAGRLGIGAPVPAAVPDAVLDVIADDLRQAGPAALLLAGAHQGETVHLLAQAMNERLGAIGTTIDFVPPAAARPEDGGTFATLAAEIADGAVDTLLILGPNPAYTAAGDVAAAEAIQAVPTSVHWGTYADETARLCRWHVPATHELESWSDLRAFDGTATIVQPLIRPLFGGRTAHEVLAAFLGDDDRSPRQIVRDVWAEAGGLDDGAFAAALQRGVVPGTGHVPVPVSFGRPDLPPRAPAAPSDLEVRFVPDPWLRAGEHANHVWLQELPRPLTKLVWGNAALVAPTTAERIGVTSGEVVEISHREARLAVPVWIEPGQPPDSITLTLGFGRSAAGTVGTGIGYNAYPLRRADSPWRLDGATVRRIGGRQRLITLQHHHGMEGRDIVRHATLEEYRHNPDVVHDGAPPPPEASVYPSWPYPHEAWGMVIDQTACIGCQACVIACQAENNIPAVGPDECDRGHEMHWLRVDRYYADNLDRPETFFQPVPCMHCEKAPCEVVCPVNATVHTADGLNAQVYNRCIGTRYCSQNCPYKVRRFNFLEYQPFGAGAAAPLAPLMNPDVSVRSRGVMEKCTYCVQRIRKASIDAEVAGRALDPDAVVTACQQACPTRAIVFGDLNRPDSEVRRLRDLPLDYALLAELNTRPRTTYLGCVRNPNPRLASPPESERGDG